MYVYRYLLVCRLEAKRVNLCTKKHIDILDKPTGFARPAYNPSYTVWTV
jgi:hypothetical protein